MKKTVKNLVLVDDEEQILKSIKRELEPWTLLNRINVLTFTTGLDALDYLEKNNKDVFLVISDLRMPMMNGSKLLQTINSLYPDIKLFLLTAYSDINEIQSAIKSSIERLIFKPWEPISLQDDVKSAFKLYITEEHNRKLKNEIDSSIKLAADFQKQILSGPKSIKGIFDFDIMYLPLDKFYCGGDFYDCLQIDDSSILIVFGDVSGHGMKPAFVTSMLKVLCSMYKSNLYNKAIDPSDFMSFLNNGLLKSLGEVKDIIVSLSIVYINHKDKTITTSGAGQMPIYVKRDNNILIIDNVGPALGFISDVDYNNEIFWLEKNDLIIMFTDGLIESEKTRNIIDDKRVRGILLTLDLKTKPTQNIINGFKKEHLDNKFADDVTVLTTKIL